LLDLPIEGKKGCEHTPLALALGRERWDEVEVLLAVGASGGSTQVKLTTAAQRANIRLAASTGRIHTLRFLSEKEAGAGRWFRDREGFTMLHYAVEEAQTEVVQWLLETEVPFEDVLRRFPTEETLLHVAVRRGLEEIVMLLVKNCAVKAGLGAKNPAGETALHMLAREGKSEIVKCVLDAGVSVDAKDRMGRTALHIAAAEGRVEVVGLLLERGARYGWDAKGALPLHTAVRNRRWGIVQEMVKRGVDVEARDRGGMTAGEHARWQGVIPSVEIQKILRGKGRGKSSTLAGRVAVVRERRRATVRGE
jgi:ankyrin repeat protein